LTHAALLVVVALAIGTAIYTVKNSLADNTGGTGGAHTDQTFLQYTAAGYTSQYHLYAAGLDWTKPVGLLIYADGSGEYGLKNPGSTYLLAGTTGMIAVAKKHNMILLTPFSPNTACSDGDGSCWYLGDPEGYVKWAEALVAHVQSLYPVERNRIAFGGYSSGAQLASEYWVPSGAAQRTMTAGVIVPISYGGSPKMTQVAYTAAFKANVHLNWNTGDLDPSYTTTSAYGVKAGYNSYTAAGFMTSIDVVPGVDHDRSGKFGSIMDAQITEHVAASTGTPIPTATTVPTPTRTPVPTATPAPTPTPTPAANPYACPSQPTLQLNSSGVCVQRVQWFLNQQAAAGLSIDGAYGPVTEAAVSSYQTSKGLTANGIVGTLTWAALEGTPPLGDTNGDNKVNVFDISRVLSAWGTSTSYADLTHDGTVNIFDLSVILSHWTG
jgi:peptidoglycan hydrolase-like protein with peptidoglycan-binding domain